MLINKLVTKPIFRYSRCLSNASYIPKTWRNALENKGISKLTPIQKLGLPVLFETKIKESAVILAETGSGKTLTYVLPIFNSLDLDTKKKFLVLVPTKSLALQVTSVVNEYAKAFNLQEQIVATTSLLSSYNCNSLVAVTPTSLANSVRNPEALNQLLAKFSQIVLDEADMLLQGIYLGATVFILREAVKLHKPVVFCGATLPKTRAASAARARVQPEGFIKRHFSKAHWLVSENAHCLDLSKVEHIIKRPKPLEHSEVALRIEELKAADTEQAKQQINRTANIWFKKARDKMLLQALGSVFGRPENWTGRRRVLIFVSDGKGVRRVAEIVASMVKKLSLDTLYETDACSIGCFSQQEDSESCLSALKTFENSDKFAILIATNALARGHDFNGCSIDAVINYSFPSDMVTYMHRAGRLGRSRPSSGKANEPAPKSLCISFVPYSVNPKLDTANVLADAIESTCCPNGTKNSVNQDGMFSRKRSLKKGLKKRAAPEK